MPHKNVPGIDYRAFNSSRNRDDREELRERVASDVERFLADGGEITTIPKGVTGYREGPRHLIINPKKLP